MIIIVIVQYINHLWFIPFDTIPPPPQYLQFLALFLCLNDSLPCQRFSFTLYTYFLQIICIHFLYRLPDFWQFSESEPYGITCSFGNWFGGNTFFMETWFKNLAFKNRWFNRWSKNTWNDELGLGITLSTRQGRRSRIVKGIEKDN